MIVKLSPGSNAYEFACRSAACAPPSAGGTGGSNAGGKGKSGIAAKFKAITEGKKKRAIREHNEKWEKDWESKAPQRAARRAADIRDDAAFNEGEVRRAAERRNKK